MRTAVPNWSITWTTRRLPGMPVPVPRLRPHQAGAPGHTLGKKGAGIRAALIKQYKNVFGKWRSFSYAVSAFYSSFSKDAGNIPTRS